MDSLIGIKTSDWFKLMAENHFAVDPWYWLKALFITSLSIKNSIQSIKEEKIYSARIKNTPVNEAPLFILGHWRSGTTHFHNFLTVDQQFAYPNIFQVKNPHTFLSREEGIMKKIAKIPSHNRPMDNVMVTIKSPGEDEFAIGMLCLYSPYLAWPFPRQEEYYDQFLTLREVSREKIDRWQEAFLFFLKKLTVRYGQQLILKSPTHTARVRLLLNIFPKAKFIHIHRNPYDVFQSTRKLYKSAVLSSYLQRPKLENLDDGIIRRYVLMYDAFFEDRNLVPKDQYAEVSFEEFEQDPIGQLAKIYSSLNLKGFQQAKPGFQSYLNSLAGYKKNKHNSLPEDLKEKINRKWLRSFEEWNYAV